MNKSVWAVIVLVLALPAFVSAEWVRFECEDAELSGAMDVYPADGEGALSGTGESAGGYVRLQNPSGNVGRVAVSMNVRSAATVDFKVGVGVDNHGEKWDTYYLNGLEVANRICREQTACDYQWTMDATESTDIHEITFEDWVTFRDAIVPYGTDPEFIWYILDTWMPSWNDAGKAPLDPMTLDLIAGLNTLYIEAGWGWASYDYIDIDIPPAPKAVYPPDGSYAYIPAGLPLEWINTYDSIDYTQIWFGIYEPNENDPNSWINPDNYKNYLSLYTTLIGPNTTAPMPALENGRSYAWVVDGFDAIGEPNENTEPNVPGVFFTFWATNNGPPDCNAGPDQYLWQTMSDPNLWLTSESIDDGDLQPLTYLWEQLEGPPITIVGALQPQAGPMILTELAGQYEYDTEVPYVFRLTVDDGMFVETDVVTVTFSRTSCAASTEAGTWPVFGDITNAEGLTTEGGDNIPDCKTDMYDLAELATNWTMCTNIFEDCD